MKTKIIYISGNELFDMADIRSAFDEVRAALSLGSDTVLFGVPVDNDDALDKPIAEQNVEPIAPKRTKKSAKVVPITDAISHQEEPQPMPEPVPEKQESVVSILSVLGTKSEETIPDQEPIQDTTEIQPDAQEEPETIIDTPLGDTESVTISEIIDEEIPTTEPEKTLEELLESMTPLGEDAEKKQEPVDDTEEVISSESVEPEKTEDDTDITLEKLATEFVENQDKIDTPAKTTTRGKIGKLKNILPFKKAKHEESGLMGDLFGWAGVAANDDDFTIPGFFK